MPCPPKRGGETTFPDKLKYTSTALRSITTDPNEPLSAVFVRAPILKRVGGAALPSLAAAIFHSQTSFLRRENRKSGACYNKRQYCITQKRARDTDRGTPSLGMQHSAGRSLAPRCGIREEEREIQKNFGMARKHAHMVKRHPLCPRRRRGMHTAIFLNGDLNVREREMVSAGVLPCFPRQ